jgi:hypothetical protein
MRRSVGATGASLAVPVGILVVAAAIVVSGGVGGVGSLGQAFSGPALPDTGTSAKAASATGNVAVTAAVPSGAGTAGAATPTGGGAGGGGLAGPTTPGTTPGPGGPPSPGARTSPPGAPPTGGGGNSSPGGGGGGAPPSSPAPGPVQQIIDTTRGLGNAVPEPVAPVTDEVLDMVLGPPQGR